MIISPNREGLKHISNFNIDSQFAQKYGSTLFSYQGEETEEYKILCDQLRFVVEDMIEDLNQIKTFISS